MSSIMNFGSVLLINGPIKVFKYRTNFGKYQISQRTSNNDLSNNSYYNFGDNLLSNPVFLIYFILVLIVHTIEAIKRPKANNV